MGIGSYTKIERGDNDGDHLDLFVSMFAEGKPDPFVRSLEMLDLRLSEKIGILRAEVQKVFEQLQVLKSHSPDFQLIDLKEDARLAFSYVTRVNDLSSHLIELCKNIRHDFIVEQQPNANMLRNSFQNFQNEFSLYVDEISVSKEILAQKSHPLTDVILSIYEAIEVFLSALEVSLTDLFESPYLAESSPAGTLNPEDIKVAQQGFASELDDLLGDFL